MQKIIIALEVPDAIPAADLIDQVSETLIDTLGAVVVSMKITTPHHTLVLQ